MDGRWSQKTQALDRLQRRPRLRFAFSSATALSRDSASMRFPARSSRPPYLRSRLAPSAAVIARVRLSFAPGSAAWPARRAYLSTRAMASAQASLCLPLPVADAGYGHEQRHCRCRCGMYPGAAASGARAALAGLLRAEPDQRPITLAITTSKSSPTWKSRVPHRRGIRPVETTANRSRGRKFPLTRSVRAPSTTSTITGRPGCHNLKSLTCLPTYRPRADCSEATMIKAAEQARATAVAPPSDALAKHSH